MTEIDGTTRKKSIPTSGTEKADDFVSMDLLMSA